jgi:DNA-binding transcriptional ArsR family regulator
MESSLVDVKKLAAASDVLRALSHPFRIKLLAFIDKQKEINVNKIYGTLKLEQSITSQNLKILRDAGLVKTERKGKFIIYSLEYDNIKNYIDSINRFLEIK